MWQLSTVLMMTKNIHPYAVKVFYILVPDADARRRGVLGGRIAVAVCRPLVPDDPVLYTMPVPVLGFGLSTDGVDAEAGTLPPPPPPPGSLICFDDAEGIELPPVKARARVVDCGVAGVLGAGELIPLLLRGEIDGVLRLGECSAPLA